MATREDHSGAHSALGVRVSLFRMNEYRIFKRDSGDSSSAPASVRMLRAAKIVFGYCFYRSKIRARRVCTPRFRAKFAGYFCNCFPRKCFVWVCGPIHCKKDPGRYKLLRFSWYVHFLFFTKPVKGSSRDFFCVYFSNGKYYSVCIGI